jgi:hypothetical protein
VEIKTHVGGLYFHAFDSRFKITEAINEMYFPENSPNAQQDDVDQSFKEFDPKENQLYSSTEINDLTKPFETVIAEKLFPNTHFCKFFRRYFSDDKFEIRGQSH